MWVQKQEAKSMCLPNAERVSSVKQEPVMQLPKGCCLLILTSLIFVLITILAFIYSLRDPEWCDVALNAGDCKMYDDDKTCYCVDTTNTGQDQIDGEWYWMKKGDEERAEEILWRPDVPPKTNDSHAIITVESIEQGDEYNYVLYNYDHYVDNDKSYQWYGITTTDNKPNHIRGTYYICHYTDEPEKSTQSNNTGISTIPEKESDHRCECDNNMKVLLLEEESSQTFTSPRYPANYCSDLNCRWTITTSQHLIIMVQLMVLSLERDMDFLYIYDGENDDSPLIQSCTGISCHDRKTSGPTVHIHFNSDHVITNIGFKFRVTATPKDACYCSQLVSISLTNVGESIVVSSPNYPNSYCPNMNCKWLITAPTDLGIELDWEKFDTEEDADFVHVLDGNQIEHLENYTCSGKECHSFTSLTTQVYMKFVSNNWNTTDIGFRFTARVVKNYCNLETLFLGIIPQLGTVTSTEIPRKDGNIPHGAVVTLVCHPHHKISNTVGQITNSATCLSPQWSNHFGTCIPACHLNFSIEYRPEDVHFCGFGDNLATQLVEKGDEVTVSRYDHVLGHRLIEKKKYTCIDANSWNEQPPLCHPMGIAIFGGLYVESRQSIELYTPNYKMQTSELLDLELLWPHEDHSAVELPSGDVLVISSKTESHYENSVESSRRVERVNINSNQVTAAPNVSIAMGGRAAVINGTVYLCGGTKHVLFKYDLSPRKACEVFQDGEWFGGVPMLVARLSFGMVAIGQSLYAIGGIGDYDEVEKSAEKYSTEEQRWTFIAPMINTRRAIGTAVLEGSIYVCGTGLIFYLHISCDIYSPKTDQWQILAANMIATPVTEFCLVAFGGKLFAFGGGARPTKELFDYDLTTVEMYDIDTGKWTSVGNTKVDRSNGAAVMVAYERNIPIKENQTRVIDSKLDHILNISALGLTKVISDKGVSIPVFVGKSEDVSDEADECSCGTHMTIELMTLEDSKTIESPGYPTGYCNYHRCLWTISAAETLEYNLAVSLEWAAFSTENLMDMVYIYDQSGLLEVCSGSHCSNHKSSGNTLFVYFESDHVTTDIGFKMVVAAIDSDPCYCAELNEVVLNSPDEGFTLESPNYPQSYCANHKCGWHISVPETYLMRINWKTFSLGNGHTFNIHAAIKGQIGTLLSSCANRDCENQQTSRNELYMEFLSNDDISSSSNIFRALITTAQSYCKKLKSPPVGSISYDKESRIDGNLPFGTMATLLCPNGYKITDSVHDIMSSITCIAPDWSDKLKTCAQVCKLDSTFKSFDHTNICTFDNDVHTDLVQVAHKLFVKEYDLLTDAMIHDHEQAFICSQSGWSPQTPVCHKLAILMYGKIEQAMEYNYNKDNKTILYLYYPEEKTTDVMETTLEVEHPEYLTSTSDYPLFQASPLNDGRVLLSGENIGSVLLNLSSWTITRMRSPVVGRRASASAQLSGEVFVCGGRSGYFGDSTVLKSCEVWHTDRWLPLDAVMNIERELLTMVATDDAVYSIGGIGSNYKALTSVEKYTPQRGSWQFVAPLEVSLYSSAAVYYHGFILLCGGVPPAKIGVWAESDKCYKYIASEDEWHDMPSMHFKRRLFSMVVFAGRVYVIGGIYSDFPIEDIPVLAIESYDNQKQEWSIETELPNSMANPISPSSLVVVNWEKSVLKLTDDF